MNKRFASLASIPSFLPLSGATLLLGIAMSFTAPYLSLFGIEQGHMTPFRLGIFMTLNAASGVVASTFAGKWSDRRGHHRELLLGALIAAAVGFVALCFVKSYLSLLIVGVLFIGVGGSAVSMVFSFGRVALPFRSEAERAFATAALRTVLSMAWVFGPSVGALVLAASNFYGLFAFAALSFIGCGMIVMRMKKVDPQKARPQSFQAARTAMRDVPAGEHGSAVMRPGVAAVDRGALGPEDKAGQAMSDIAQSLSPDPASASMPTPDNIDAADGAHSAHSVSPGPRVDRATLWRSIIALTLLGLVANATIIILPLYIVQGFNGTRIDVSIMLGLGAFLEIPMMLALGARSERLNKLRWLAACAAVHAVYFVAVAIAWNLPILIPMQALAAFVVAVTSCLGMAYVQDLMPETPAAATALFFNAARVGSIMSGVLSGIMVGSFGYKGSFLGCGLLAFVALWLFLNPAWLRKGLAAGWATRLAARPIPALKAGLARCRQRLGRR